MGCCDPPRRQGPAGSSSSSSRWSGSATSARATSVSASAITGSGYVVTADFAESGGIFKGAEVTYRGVDGRPGRRLRLAADGVHVDLRLDRGVTVPRTPTPSSRTGRRSASSTSTSSRATRGAPYLAGGDRIPESRTRTPIHTETLLVNLDRLVNSVDRRDLTTVIDELDAAFAGTGPDLQRLHRLR